MARAIAGDATRSHFASLSNKLRKHSKIFVIDPERLVSAKATYFPAKHRPPAWSAFVVVRPFTIGSRPTFHLCHRLLPLSLNLRCDSIQEFALKFIKPSCRNGNKKFIQHHSGELVKFEFSGPSGGITRCCYPPAVGPGFGVVSSGGRRSSTCTLGAAGLSAGVSSSTRTVK
jgi:hypothetical protein